jgi:exodeoxyribonuclease VII large subunit
MQVYTISQLNSTARQLLEDNFPPILVEGEISNLACPSSGHIYFSLKDEFAQVRCAMFRNHNHGLDFTPENGMHVLVQAQVSIYEQRGDYQLIIYHMEAAGVGILRRKFEELKKKLLTEGLFAKEHKKTIPKLANCIGVITSATGAAIRDIISVLKRRFAGIPIIIYPAQVQGDQAAKKIVDAIETANQHNKCDVLIIARGGGSLEDLWPFNEEIVARSIFASQIPIVTGVGHEVDFTIADFVADVRAPTPSAAAELLSPDRADLLNMVEHLHSKFSHLLNTKLRNYAQNLDNLEQRLSLAINNFLKHKESKLVNLSRALAAISPLATLNRGYAIITTKDDKILRNSEQVNIGDKVNAKLKKGNIKCMVEEVLS